MNSSPFDLFKGRFPSKRKSNRFEERLRPKLAPHKSTKVMNRSISSILFFVVFTLCVNTGFSAFFTPRVEVVMGRFCMMNPRESGRNLNQRYLLNQQKVRIQMQPNANGMLNLSCAFLMAGYSAWLEVKDGFEIEALWVDSKTRNYISFCQPSGNGNLQLETGVLSEEQQNELGEDVDKVPEISRFHGSSPKLRKAINAWEMVFFLPPEEEKALQQVLQIQQSQRLDSLRKKFLFELMQTQNHLEEEEARTQKPLNALLEEGRKYIRELDSDSFQTRRLAGAKLRDLGWAVITLASETDWSKLSPEAERQLSFIIQEIDQRGEFEDVIQLDVRGWSCSPRIWAAALKFGTNSQKKFAWKVLEKKFPDLFEKKLRSIGLDLEASPAEIQEKIEKIYETVQEEH